MSYLQLAPYTIAAACFCMCVMTGNKNELIKQNPICNTLAFITFICHKQIQHSYRAAFTV